MTQNELLKAMEAPGRTVICHRKSSGLYIVTAHSKAKLNGEWHEGVNYISLTDQAQYWRPYTDFEGFDLKQHTD